MTTAEQESGLQETAKLLSDSREKMLNVAAIMALTRNLETLQNAAILCRQIKAERPPARVEYWVNKMERAITELTDYLVPDETAAVANLEHAEIAS